MHNASTTDWKAVFGITDHAPCNHEALKASDAWDRLPSIGLQQTDDLPLDLRNCDRCHTTLARPVPTTAQAIADVVSRDSRPAVHFAMPEGDVTALRDELEERYALSSAIADCWDCDDLRRVKRLVVSASEDDAGTEASELEAAARKAEVEYDEWQTFGRRAR